MAWQPAHPNPRRREPEPSATATTATPGADSYYHGGMSRRPLRLARLPYAAAIGAALAAVVLLVVGACSSNSSTEPTTTTTTGTGGSGGASTSGGSGGTTTTTSTTSSTGGSGGTTTAAGGEGGVGGAWPSCDSPPVNVPQKTLHEIWIDDPAVPTEVWVPGVYVTAVSAGGCSAGSACTLFVQQLETFADATAGAQQALRLFASPGAAEHFTGIAVGDRLDIYAHAWRYDLNGQNELLLQVSLALRGCAKVVGAGVPQPVTGLSLPDLTVDAYETTLGPLLIQVDTVSGKPKTPPEIFGLWETGVFADAGIDEVTSLSPYFLPGSVFTGLTTGVTTDFTSITGVFGLFVPPGQPVTKYEVLYIRDMADAPHN